MCVLVRHEWSNQATCEEMLSVQHALRCQSERAIGTSWNFNAYWQTAEADYCTIGNQYYLLVVD